VRRPWRGIAALLAGTAFLVVALIRILSTFSGQGQSLYQRPVPTSPPAVQATPLVTSQTVVPVPAVAIGVSAGLGEPREALQLANGRFAVVDTGHSRLVILDPRGRVLHSSGPPLVQPYAIAAGHNALYVLDSRLGAIERYDLNGRFLRPLVQGVALGGAKGMGIAPNGTLYVANPTSNSIVAVSPQGRIVQIISSPLSNRLGEFNQPSDVAVGPHGDIYVVDNVNMRIEELGPHGEFRGLWAIPPSVTSFSVHALPLSDGRLLASDPSGSLILYRPGGPVTRISLQTHGQPPTTLSPLGLAPGRAGTIVVTDNRGGRIFLATLPAKGRR
jgi:glucose/arabinose dehydrogenase